MVGSGARGCRLTTVGAVIVLQLGQTSPLVGRDVLAVVQQPSRDVVQGELEVLLAITGELVKVQPRQSKVSGRPEPSGTLMVVPTLGDGLIVRIVRIVVIPSVSGIGRVERPHPQGRLQVLVGQLERDHGSFGSEELGSVVHCDGEVGSELVVRPLPVLGGTIHVLVDTSSIHHARVDVKRRVLGRVLGDPVTPLKVGLE